METRVTLRPGQKGTLKLLRKYGDRLVRVRYRCDRALGRRYTTVELIVAERPWLPVLPAHLSDEKQIVNIRLAYSEFEIRRDVKAAGGVWNPQLMLWALPLGEVRRLGLLARVVH